MITDIIKNEQSGSFSKRQQLFFKYLLFVFIDLTVLNFFNQYWSLVDIADFSTSLLAALLLQVLLQLTIAIEHRAADFFNKKSGTKAKVLRWLSAWGILFTSKLVILEAINIFFSDSVIFGGPIHGLVAFIAVVIAIIIAEQLFLKVYRLLA